MATVHPAKTSFLVVFPSLDLLDAKNSSRHNDSLDRSSHQCLQRTPIAFRDAWRTNAFFGEGRVNVKAADRWTGCASTFIRSLGAGAENLAISPKHPLKARWKHNISTEKTKYNFTEQQKSWIAAPHLFARALILIIVFSRWNALKNKIKQEMEVVVAFAVC